MVVLLIAENNAQVNPIEKAFKKEKISLKLKKPGDKHLGRADVYILPADSPEPKGFKKLLFRIKGRGLTIVLCKEESRSSLKGEKILLLSNTVSPYSLAGIVKWYLKNRDRNICTELLKSFFKGGKIQIFLLNHAGKIVSFIPADTQFLGHTVKEKKKMSFLNVFGIGIDDIPETESGESHIRNLLNSNNKEVSCNISKIPYSMVNIPGIPESTRWAVLATEVSEIKDLKDKSERMSLIRDSMTKERTVELESANEMLQKQALELKHTLEELEKKNRQIVEELSLASELQKSLLPKEFPADLPLDFAHKYIPYAYIGGDFFDIVRLDKSKIGIIIADVSGHGVSSAFITTMFKSQFDIFGPKSLSPAETLANLNREFTSMIHTEHYITAFYSIIDTEKMICTYCNAGHPNQFLFRDSGEVVELSTMGFFLGMFEGTEYEDRTINLKSGDRILYNTDGIIETTDAEGEQFGKENIIKVMRDNKDNDLETVSNNLLSEIMMYMSDPTFQDDITILLTEVIETL